MPFPVITAVANVLAHAPGLVPYGSKPLRDLVRDPALLDTLRARLRPYSEAVGYPPNQAYVGNLEPESLRMRPLPWFASPDRTASNVGSFGDIIDEAELLCFPIGSFWTSVMACLLPSGVGRAVARAGCPKVYVPNLGRDPEELGLAPHDQVRVLLEQLRRDAGEQTPTEQLLHFVLVDRERGEYVGGLDIGAIEALGVEVIDTPLVSDETAPLIESRRLVELLLSLV